MPITVVMHGLQLALVMLCVWAIVRGAQPERWGAILLLTDLAARGGLKLAGVPFDFTASNLPYLLLTAVMFSASLVLAARSNRVWTLFFSALWLVQLAGHVAAMGVRDGWTTAYWAITQVPLILQTLVLGLGTAANLRRESRGILAQNWY